VQRGFALELVCPSEQLNAMARAKRPPGTTVHTSTFEAFDSPVRFDLCLFAESFHYLALGPALAQAARCAGRGAVICDYFRRAATGGDTRGTHAEFLNEVARQGAFRIARDEELTAAIPPRSWCSTTSRTRLSGLSSPRPGSLPPDFAARDPARRTPARPRNGPFPAPLGP
jgi:hypothetical protein